MNKWIPILALILLAVGAYAYSQGLLKFAIFGFTTLSLQQVQFFSTDPILNGKVWVLTVTPGGMGQYAVGGQGTIPSGSIKTAEGKALNDLTIKVESLKQSCNYPILIDYNKETINKYYYKKFAYFVSDSDIYAECGKFGYVLGVGKFAFSFDKFCVYYVREARLGNLPERPNVEVKVDVSVSSKGQTFTASISNKEQTQAKMGDVAYVQWSGGLKTYDECPQALQQNVMGAYKATTSNWQLIDSTSYNNYLLNVYSKVSDANYLSAFLSKAEGEVSTTLNSWNSYANSAIAPKVFTSPKGAAGVTTGTTTVNGLTVIDIDDSIFIPVLTFYVKTDWLGIVQPVAAPKIVNIIAPKFGAASTGYATIQVQNVGNEAGTISVYATCPAPFTITSGTKQLSLNPGESGSVVHTIVVSGITAETSATCTATAQALSSIDTKTFTATASPVIVCEANKRVCKDDNVWVCNAQGSQLNELDNCVSKNRVCGIGVTGELECVEKGKPPTCRVEGQSVNPSLGEKCCSGLTPAGGFLGFGQTCQKAVPGIPWELVIPGVFAALVFLLVGKDAIGDRDKVGIAIAAIAAIIVFLVVYWIVVNWLLVLLLSVTGILVYIVLIVLFGGVTGIFWMFRKRG